MNGFGDCAAIVSLLAQWIAIPIAAFRLRPWSGNDQSSTHREAPMKLRSNKRSVLYAVAGVVIVAGLGAIYANFSGSTETTVAALAKETHFHGIAVDPADPARVYLGTHHGLYLIGTDGKARRISETRDDFMGFTAHPTGGSVLFASGHPSSGGNLGFIASRDGGRSWQKISQGINGPVDFHQMDVSKADPKVIYGVYGNLQRSSDEGRTWTRVGPPPSDIIGLAASSIDANTLYAATQSGLQRSTDGGRSWTLESDRPAIMVHVTRDGRIFAFLIGIGLVRAAEKDLAWQVVGKGFGEDRILHFAADPADQQRCYAVTFDSRTHAQSVIVSRDGGASWSALGGSGA
jgi:photosystem II stability/assembly factor-like uncharacterized protein